MKDMLIVYPTLKRLTDSAKEQKSANLSYSVENGKWQFYFEAEYPIKMCDLFIKYY